MASSVARIATTILRARCGWRRRATAAPPDDAVAVRARAPDGADDEDGVDDVVDADDAAVGGGTRRSDVVRRPDVRGGIEAGRVEEGRDDPVEAVRACGAKLGGAADAASGVMSDVVRGVAPSASRLRRGEGAKLGGVVGSSVLLIVPPRGVLRPHRAAARGRRRPSVIRVSRAPSRSSC
nr:hypothetical protein [Bifidobacterium sp. AGR2158]